MDRPKATGAANPAVPPQKPATGRAAQKAARLKNALRENLRRRKAQDAARADKNLAEKEKS